MSDKKKLAVVVSNSDVRAAFQRIVSGKAEEDDFNLIRAWLDAQESAYDANAKRMRDA